MDRYTFGMICCIIFIILYIIAGNMQEHCMLQYGILKLQECK